jgi:hypothetical protein
VGWKVSEGGGMQSKQVFKWAVVAAVGGLALAAAWLFVQNPSYNLMLIHPLVLIAFYLAFYGGGLAFLAGLAMTLRAIMKSRNVR